MKKVLSLLLAVLICVSLCSCTAFKDSSSAFEDIKQAYNMTNDYSMCVYEAWRLGVYDSSSYDSDYYLDDLAEELNVTDEEIEKAVASLMGKTEYEYGDWSDFCSLYDDDFSAFVDLASEIYKTNGKVKKITKLLESAKEKMQDISGKHSDYEHYPTLKKFFTNTIAFFDFCKNPEGSFEQVVETFNSYRNNAREYFFDLNYIFGDSINGMEETTTAKK